MRRFVGVLLGGWLFCAACTDALTDSADTSAKDRVLLVAEAVLTASDKPAAFQEYAHALADVYETYGAAEARFIAESASRDVFGHLDSAARNALQRDLGGRAYGLGAPFDTAQDMLRVEILHVNGAWNFPDEAIVAALETRAMAEEARIPARVALFYNATHKAGFDAHVQCVLRSLAESAVDYVGAANGLAACFTPGRAVDLVEVVRQILDLLAFVPYGSEEAARLADHIRSLRQAGTAVVVLGHSQGALLAQQALWQLPADRCVLGVSLGDPLGKESWPLANKELAGFVVSGEVARDIVLRLGRNNFAKIETSVGRDADAIVREAEGRSRLGTLGIIALAEIAQLQQELRVHSFIESYAAGVESRQLIKEIVFRHTETLGESSRECFSPPMPPEPPAGIAAASYDGHLFRIDPYPTGTNMLLGKAHQRDGGQIKVKDVVFGGDRILVLGRINMLFELNPASFEAQKRFTVDAPFEMESFAVDTRPNSPTAGHIFAIGDFWARLLRLDPQRLKEWYEFGEPPVWQEIGIVDTPDRRLIPDGRYGDIAFGPDGMLYAAVPVAVNGYTTASLLRIDPETGEVLWWRPTGERRIEGLVFAGDTLYGFTAGKKLSDMWLVKLDLQTGQTRRIRELRYNEHYVLSVSGAGLVW